MKRAGGIRLVGDLGGTNVRFALAELSGARATLIEPRAFQRTDFDSLEDAVTHYLDECAPEQRPREAVIAVAGPVIGGSALLTNGDWGMSEASLAACGFQFARLINDFAALSLALPLLDADDLGLIGPAQPNPRGTMVVVGAGTGLGVGALVRDGAGQVVAVTEGGHVAFAPTDDLDVEILRRLSRRFGRVSLERILSGPGLVNLHQAIAEIRGVSAGAPGPEAVVAGAAGGDPVCAETLDRFCAIYGAAAGDFALTYGATGGVFLGGGIAPRILDVLRRSAFRERFEAKGRFQAYVAPIATAVILHPHAALLGAARAPNGAR